LECGRRVAESEEHDCGFVEPERCFEGGFPFVSFLDPDVVVSPSDVEFGEDA
jgi:hypothetical protein